MVYIALDEKGNRVAYNETKHWLKYFCLCCGEEMYRCNLAFIHSCNEMDRERFFYKSSDFCSPVKSYFDVENVEVGLRDENNEYFRADVVVGDLVLELVDEKYFVTKDKFNKVTEKVLSMGYDIIWLFNISSHIKKYNTIRYIEDDKYESKVPLSFLLDNKYNVPVFFCRNFCDETKYDCWEVTDVSEDGKIFRLNGSGCKVELKRGTDINVFRKDTNDYRNYFIEKYKPKYKYINSFSESDPISMYRCPKTGKEPNEDVCTMCNRCVGIERQRDSDIRKIYCSKAAAGIYDGDYVLPPVFYVDKID